MDHSIIWNNVRFLKYNLTLTGLKFFILITGQLSLSIYFFTISEIFHADQSGIHLSFSYHSVMTLLSIILLSCFAYLFAVHYSLRLRKKETFVRKWFGESSTRIFLNLLTEQLLIVGFSVVISLVVFDLLTPALYRIEHYEASISSIRKLSYVPIFTNSLVVLLTILPRLLFFSNTGRNEVLEKIAL